MSSVARHSTSSTGLVVAIINVLVRALSIKIIIGKPVSRDQLPENDSEAIEELKRLSDSLKKKII